MIKGIKITNYLGDSIDLPLMNPEKSGFIITGINGLGPVKANINVTDISSNDGALFNSARLSTRNIVLQLRFTKDRDVEKTRILSYKYFPIKKYLTLTVETDTRKATCTGYVESNEPTIFSENEGCQISIICPDPYFYAVDEGGTSEVVFSGLEPVFEFPFCNDSLEFKLLEMGDIQNLRDQNVPYNGDANNGVTIKMHALGRVENVTIYNVGTREKMSINSEKLAALTGSGIVSGDTITITTMRGNKRITLLRNSVETNILNCINRDANWFQLAKGDNVFTYTATYGAFNIQFSVTSQTIYEGV